jgi:hypothetical protein
MENKKETHVINASHCPICNGTNKNYNDYENDGEMIRNFFKCGDCLHEGFDEFRIIFQGTMVMFDQDTNFYFEQGDVVETSKSKKR